MLELVDRGVVDIVIGAKSPFRDLLFIIALFDFFSLFELLALPFGERDRELPPEFGSELFGTGDGTLDLDSCCRENKFAIGELESKFEFDNDFDNETRPGLEIGICDCEGREFDHEHGLSFLRFGDKIFDGNDVFSFVGVAELELEFEFELELELELEFE